MIPTDITSLTSRINSIICKIQFFFFRQHYNNDIPQLVILNTYIGNIPIYI